MPAFMVAVFVAMLALAACAGNCPGGIGGCTPACQEHPGQVLNDKGDCVPVRK